MIIFLNGIPNSGKSTVAREIVKLLPNTVNCELDFIFEMYNWMPLSEGIGLLMENARTLLPSFLKRDLNVVLSYPLDRYWHDYLTSSIPNDVETYTILLTPPLDVVLTNRGTREASPALQARIGELYVTNSQFVTNHRSSSKGTAERLSWGGRSCFA